MARRKLSASIAQPTPASGNRPRFSSHGFWLPLAIVTVVVLIYYNSLGIPFVFDDEYSVVKNVSIRTLWPLSVPLNPPYDAAGAAGRPLFNLSLAVNYAIGGLDVRGYHIFNIALHAANALLLWALVRRTLRMPSVTSAYRDSADRIAACVTGLWLAHPLLTISVAVTQQRTELMGAFFILLSLHAFSHAAAGEDKRSAWSILAVLACAAGMASKETAAAIPILAWFYDRTFIAGSFAESWRRRRGLLLALVSTWGLLAWVMFGTNQRAGSVGFGLGVGLWEYLLTQCEAITRYLALSFWPAPLVFDYGVITVKTLQEVIWQAMMVVGLLAGTVWALVRRPGAGFLGLFFFLVLAPSSSFVPVVTQTMGEQRMYLPLAAVAAGLGLMLGRWVTRRIAVAAVLGVAALAAVQTIARNKDYATEIGIWRDTLRKRPDNIRAHMNLASSLHAKGQGEEAIQILQEVLAKHMHRIHESGFATLQHWDARIYSGLGEGRAIMRQYAEAEVQFKKAIELNPKHASAHFNLGKIYADQKRYAESAEHYETAIELKPDDREAMLNYGRMLILAGNARRAEQVFAGLIVLEPLNVAARMDYADAILLQGRYEEGRRLYQDLQQLDPRNQRINERLTQLSLMLN
ncbi:MAG: tetratricopeptide repeat protein [Opitutaceae bacterium]|jgi:tetratricopeptide (TPR) repeat protein